MLRKLEDSTMVRNIKSNKKYLLLIPLVISLIMLTFFSAAFDEIIREKHELKYSTVHNSLNYIVSVFDRFVEANMDWGSYDYTSVLTQVFTGIDEMSAIRVTLLNHDLTPITGSFIDDLGTPYDLLGCDEFIRAVNESDDSGELTITVVDGVTKPYELLIYFKKIPTGEYENKLVAVYGVSQYSVEDNFAPWLTWGVVGLVSMTVLLQIWMILYIAKLSDAEQYARKKAGVKR
jgi:hypothetical protein